MVTIKERKSFIIICGFIGIFLFSSCVEHSYLQQPGAPYPEAQHLNERIDNQFKAIDRGVQLGHFTRHEERILLDNLDYIRDQEARFQASGIFTVTQRQHLHTLIDQNALMLTRQRPVQTLRLGH